MNVAAILADGWFYIYALGLMLSGVLFFYLLGQYRAAAAAADEHHEVEAPIEAPVAVRPVFAPQEPAPAPKIVAETEPAPEPKLAAEPVPRKAGLTGSTVTGGISPAVVYLQNIKNQLELMSGEMKSLSKRVEALGERDEALIERLGELAQAIASMKAAPEAEAPKRVKKAESAVEPLKLEPNALVTANPPAAAEPDVKLKRGPVWPV